MAKSAPLDPEKLIKVLARHRVRFVLIGALAARLQGARGGSTNSTLETFKCFDEFSIGGFNWLRSAKTF